MIIERNKENQKLIELLMGKRPIQTSERNRKENDSKKNKFLHSTQKMKEKIERQFRRRELKNKRKRDRKKEEVDKG